MMQMSQIFVFSYDSMLQTGRCFPVFYFKPTWVPPVKDVQLGFNYGKYTDKAVTSGRYVHDKENSIF